MISMCSPNKVIKSKYDMEMIIFHKKSLDLTDYIKFDIGHLEIVGLNNIM